MKKITVLSVALLAVGLAAFAETETSATISNVVVRQRWPWKGVVDIDFTVRGKATGVKFVAKYDGVEPFTLAEKDLSGEFAEILEPGIHSVTWNPEKAGLDKTELKNFFVSVEPEDKTYLILNLVDGSYHYAAAEPEGGWLADPANYQTNIVFRRIPKGTKNLVNTSCIIGYRMEESCVGSDCIVFCVIVHEHIAWGILHCAEHSGNIC